MGFFEEYFEKKKGLLGTPNFFRNPHFFEIPFCENGAQRKVDFLFY